MLNQTLAQLMQRLLEKRASSTPLGATSRRLQNDLRIGRIQGKTLYLSEGDLNEMRALLTARGYSLTPVDLKGMSRSDRLAAGTPNEKAGGGALKTGRISIKALGGKMLNISGTCLPLPDRCHVDIDWRPLSDEIKHDSIMLVENYEVFDRIHQLNFALPEGCSNPLVIYRGDKHESRFDSVKAFFDASSLPIIAFVDMDPKGLHIAGCCPRLRGIVAPCLVDLEAALSSPKIARHDLFRSQLPGVDGYLRSITKESPIYSLWNLMQRHRAGAVQERWIADSIPCTLWEGSPSVSV